MEAKRTPTPWVLKPHQFDTQIYIEGANGQHIGLVSSASASVRTEGMIANSELIVRAVNCHADLLAALKAMLADALITRKDLPTHVSIMAADAIAKAEGAVR